MSASATTSIDELKSFTWSRDDHKASSNSYGLKPQVILDLFAHFDPNLDVTGFSCEPGTKFGDNFACTIYRVDVNAVKCQESAGSLNPLSKMYNLILKVLPTDPGRALFINTLGSFEKESTMYGKVLPELVRFQKQVGIVARDLWLDFPLCYGSMVDGKGDYLGLEDLSYNGYTMANRRLGLDKAHCAVALQSLGKFHAISYARFKGDRTAMLKAYPELMERAWKLPGTPSFEVCQAWVEQAMQTLISELRDGAFEHEAQLLEADDFATKNICKHIFEFVTKPVRHAVIGHGDTWTNNMLFKYMDGKSEPVGLKLIDWQISRVCSRVIDLGYFLMTPTDAGYDAKVEEDYLRIYYDAFANHATKLGFFNSEELTFDQLKEEYDEFRLYGFLAAMVIFPIVYGDEKKAIDPDEMFGGTDEPLELGTVLKIGTLFGGHLDTKALERLSNLIAVQLPIVDL